MRIYLAAPYAVRDLLRPFADQLVTAGHIMTASWLQATHEIHAGTLETAPDLSDEYAREHSTKDVEEVAESDLVILVTWPTAELLAWQSMADLGGNSGGRHVETGVALALGIDVVTWGEPENIFHRGLCQSADTWDDVMAHVTSLHNARFGISDSGSAESDTH